MAQLTLKTLSYSNEAHRFYFSAIEDIYHNVQRAAGNRQTPFGTIIDRFNIFGIRVHPTQVNASAGVDIWNDVLGVWDREEKKIYLGQGTTDPGLGKSFYKRKAGYDQGVELRTGMDHLEEGFHYNMWKIGMHNKEYTALVQCSPVTIWIDMNFNNVFDEGDIRVCGANYWGINMHCTTYNTPTVGQWSTGCQVWRYRDDFTVIINLLQRHRGYFSYLLMPLNSANRVLYDAMSDRSIIAELIRTANAINDIESRLNGDIDRLFGDIDRFCKG